MWYSAGCSLGAEKPLWFEAFRGACERTVSMEGVLEEGMVKKYELAGGLGGRGKGKSEWVACD